jgi:hypothetical protein
MIHKFFQSGLVDQPAEERDVDRLIQIYARAVSTTLALDEGKINWRNIRKREILDALKKGKKNAPLSKKSYFTALQEYVAAVIDSYKNDNYEERTYKRYQDSPTQYVDRNWVTKRDIEVHNGWKPHELSQLNKQAGTSLTFSDLEQLHKTARYQDPLSFKPEAEYLFPLQTATTRPLSDLFIPQGSGEDSRDSKDSKGRP